MSDPVNIHVPLLHELLSIQRPRVPRELASKLAFSAASLTAELQRLREAGCVLDEHPHQGVRLARSGLATWRDYLAWTLPLSSDGGAVAGPRLIEVYQRTSSTQDAARRLIAAHGDKARGVLVLADEQLAGRGRLGRRWSAPPGRCVMLSYVMAGPVDGAALAIDFIVPASALAVALGVEVAAPGIAPLGVKWPNDVLAGGRKLAGILVESVTSESGTRAFIIGIGVNVDLRPDDLPAEDSALRARVTSLAMLGLAVDRLRVIVEVVTRLEAMLAAPDATALHEAWQKRSVLRGRSIVANCDGQRIEGEVIDLDPRQGLIVRDNSGTMRHLPAACTSIEAW